MKNNLLLKALYKETVTRPPIWLMRQAGRYLPEYQRIRSKVTFLDLCYNPELACEVSIQPYTRFKMDAVIVFSDILLPAQRMGLELDFEGGGGPKFAKGISSEEEIKKLIIPEPNNKTYPTLDAIKLLKKEVGQEVPILGFSGAPWTMFCYMVEGGSSQHFYKAKTFLYGNPTLAKLLLEKITNTLFLYLTMQAKSGASALQIFDTWAGILSLEDYSEFAFPYLKELVNNLKPLNIPIILYTNTSNHLMSKLSTLEVNAFSVDWRCDLQKFRNAYGAEIGLQGNLDPTILMTTPAITRQKTREMIAGIENWNKGYICNLGHGILPEAQIENVEAMIETVHEFAQKPVYA